MAKLDYSSKNLKHKKSSSIQTFLAVCILLFLVSCTSKEDRVVAIINGKQIKIKDLKESVSKENWNKEYLTHYLDEVVESEVITYEANRLAMSEFELFSAFDMLKTRELKDSELEQAFRREFKDMDMKSQSREKILELVRTRQFEKAKKAYIKEMKDRSTIRILYDQLDKGL